MRLTFLGTGTSTGVPMIGCRCPVCASDDRRNKRLRTSALLEVGGLNLLFDAGPDLRQQALAVGLTRLDAVLLTHGHADHIAGLDDVRPLNFAHRAAIPLYGTSQTLASVCERFSYAFAETNASAGSTRPSLSLVEIDGTTPFSIKQVRVVPFEVQHGAWTITGFRIGSLGYVTDASALPPASLDRLRDLDLLVINMLRIAPHPTHFSLAQALAHIAALRPQRALLVHMAHDIDHATVDATLPDGVGLAYDGQVVEIQDP